MIIQLEPMNIGVIFGSLILLFVVLMAVFKGLRIRVAETKEFVVVGLSASLFALLSLQSWVYRINMDSRYLLYEKLALIPIIFIVLTGFVYYEGLITVKPAYTRLISFISMIMICLLLVILNLLNLFINAEDMHIITTVATMWLFCIFHIFAIWVFQRILRIYRVKPVILDFFALICVGISGFLGGLTYLLDLLQIITSGDNLYNTLIVIAGFLIIIGIGTLSINNVKWGDYIYHIPIPVYAAYTRFCRPGRFSGPDAGKGSP